MDIIKKGYSYSYSFLRISYIFLLRLFYKDYTEKRKSLENNKENYTENIHALFGCCSHIIDNIYLGNAYNAANYDILKEMNIDCIINITNNIPNYYEDYFEYITYRIKDNNHHSIKEFLIDSFNFINRNKNKKNKCFWDCKTKIKRLCAKLSKFFGWKNRNSLYRV